MRVAASAGGLIFAGFVCVFPAEAQSLSCIQLQNQLSALNSGVAASRPQTARHRNLGRAINDQRKQIKKTSGMAWLNGCRIGLFNRTNRSTCGRILTSLKEMKANLAKLEKEYRIQASQNTGADEQNRRALMLAMNRRGCMNEYQRRSAGIYPRKRSLIEQIFGVRTFGNDGRRGFFEQPDFALSSRYNTYRTMCVREKDGYYFPVSFSTTPDRFEIDEFECQSKCPGKNVSLYYHQMPTQDSEDMVSFRGQIPYTELPSAFAYRKKFDPEATCRFSSGVVHEFGESNFQLQQPVEASNSVVTSIGTPVFRTDRSLDPESIANQAGLFGEVEIAQLLMSPRDGANAGTVSSNGRKVRVVGPAFYPVQ